MSGLNYKISPAVAGTAAPPIPKSQQWATTYLASSPAPSLPVLNLSQGVPKDAPHPSVLSALSATAGHPDAARYGPILGEPSLRAALAEETNVLYRLGSASPSRTISPSEVGITTGCNMAHLLLFMALCPAHTSSVLIPSPAYFNHSMSLSLLAIHPTYLPCDPANAFSPDLGYARKVLKAGGEVVEGRKREPRLIILTTPNNPTGAVYGQRELDGWFELAKEFGVGLLLDETYRDFVDPQPEDDHGEAQGRGIPHGLFARDDWRETLISCGSFSKSYRIPGHRLGFIIGPHALLQHVTTLCDCMQICPPRPAQLALAPLLASLRPDLADASKALAHRRQIFKDVVEKVPGWKVSSMGAFYAFVEFPDEYKKGSEEVGKMLGERCGVVLLVGAFFMPEGQRGEDKWLRFAIANVSDEVVLQLGPRLEMLNRIMGMGGDDQRKGD